MVVSLRVYAAAAVLICIFIGAGFLVATVRADTLVWQGQVFSSGADVVSLVLNAGSNYRIEAVGTWWYNYAGNLAADAMFYTTDFSNSIF